MTVIAGMVLGNTMAMAGDRAATVNGSVFRLSRPKVASKGSYLVGYYGSMEGQRLLDLLTLPEPPHKTTDLDTFMYSTVLKDLYRFYDEQRFDADDQENGLGLLIMVRGSIYSHDITDGSMIRYDQPYLAVGSGSSFALGALSVPRKSAKDAVRSAVGAACVFNAYCREPIDVLTKTFTRSTHD